MAEEDPVLAVLVELESEDKLDPETIVTAAADPGSPLHSKFEWNNEVAGHQFRLEQARRLVRRYREIHLDAEAGKLVYRKFTHVKSQSHYVGTERAVRDHRQEILAAARRDMRTYQAKYRLLGSDALLDIANEVLGEGRG